MELIRSLIFEALDNCKANGYYEPNRKVSDIAFDLCDDYDISLYVSGIDPDFNDLSFMYPHINAWQEAQIK